MDDLYKQIYLTINRGTSLTDKLQVRMTRACFNEIIAEVNNRGYFVMTPEFKYFMGVPLLIVPGQGKWCQVVKTDILDTWFLDDGGSVQ